MSSLGSDRVGFASARRGIDAFERRVTEASWERIVGKDYGKGLWEWIVGMDCGNGSWERIVGMDCGNGLWEGLFVIRMRGLSNLPQFRTVYRGEDRLTD